MARPDQLTARLDEKKKNWLSEPHICSPEISPGAHFSGWSSRET